MINKDRIVPITRTDLISMYELMLALSNARISKIVDAVDADGNFELTERPTTKYMLASEPVSTFDFVFNDTEQISDLVVYFVPAYDYSGFSLNGSALPIASDSYEVEADGCTLYEASIVEGNVLGEYLVYLIPVTKAASV